MKSIARLFFITGIAFLCPGATAHNQYKATIEALFDSLTAEKKIDIEQKSVADYMKEAAEYVQAKNIDAAIQMYKHILVIAPHHHEAYYCLGNIFFENNQLDDALESFKTVLSLNDTHVWSHLNCAKVYVRKNDTSNAKKHFEAVIALDPDHREAVTELARILCDEQQYEESIKVLEQLRSKHPDDVHILFQLANTLNTAHYTEESLVIYNSLHKKYPQSSAITYNIAYTLKKLGRITEALEYYDKTLTLDSQHAEAHFSRGLAYLATGKFKEGWEEYEWRWKRDTQHMEKRNLSKPQWDGSDLQGKTLLLHAEQGLGDTFQFIRYAKIARDKGGVVIAAVQNPLVDILSLCPYIDRVVSLTAPLPMYDVHAPLLSVPYILQTVEETVPHDIPYLYAHTQLVEYWKDKLSADKNFKIGICWQGNPNYNTPFLRAVVAAKSIKLKQLEPLFKIPGVSVYNLQKMTGEEQLSDIPVEWNLIQFDDNFDKIHGRFMDTAAVIKNLDLVITVDTGLAHIAAGLGAHVWTFIPNPPDWRWMLDRTDTPWYPNMTLFRQPKPGDWESVIRDIANRLALLVAQGKKVPVPHNVADLIEAMVIGTIKKAQSPKESGADQLQRIQQELTQKNLDHTRLQKIKEYTIQLSDVHHESLRIAILMQTTEPMTEQYCALAKEYCSLHERRTEIKKAINDHCS